MTNSRKRLLHDPAQGTSAAISAVRDVILIPHITLRISSRLFQCTEWIDNGGKVLDLILPEEAQLDVESRQELLGGLNFFKGEALRASGQATEFPAIPYYA